jgi:hypothetical protein
LDEVALEKVTKRIRKRERNQKREYYDEKEEKEGTARNMIIM